MELLAWTESQDARLSRAVQQVVMRRKERLRDLARVLPRPDALLNDPRQRLDRAEEALPRALRQTVERRAAALNERAGAIRPSTLRARLAAESTRVSEWSRRLGPALARGISRRADRLDATRLRSAPIKEQLNRQRRDLDLLAPRLDAAMSTRLTSQNDRIEALDRLRRSIGYEETLKRGYSVVRSGDTIVTDAKAAENAGALEIQFRDGRVAVTTGAKIKPAKDKPQKPEQGSLF